MTIDLKTGEVRSPRPEDYCTKRTAIAPATDATCSRWMGFLSRVTAGDKEFIAYLQRLVGYCLTGHTTEHAIFFLYGTGANGKSVFVNTVSGIMGDYAVTAPIETFTETRNERHETELARLQGARLVTSTETIAGKYWNEARIKMLTGGDKVSARYMRQDYFEYMPHFKLMISGNHKPAMRSVGEAMRRRLHLIPFTVTIPPNERDPELLEKLKEEWPGILRWATEGTALWRKDGLKPPQVVVNATAEYFDAEDDIENWIRDRCVRDSNGKQSSTELYHSWRDWAEQTGRAGGAGSQKVFSDTLRDKGFILKRVTKGSVFLGLRLTEETAA
jgi:putative DNA primase/helicase